MGDIADALLDQYVGADLNLTHPAGLNLTRGWVPAL
jgi:hypothetical protein